jgi:hypothetical protein
MTRQLSLSLSPTSTLAVGYNIQSTVTSVFSLSVNITIPHLTILEFIFEQQN